MGSIPLGTASGTKSSKKYKAGEQVKPKVVADKPQKAQQVQKEQRGYSTARERSGSNVDQADTSKNGQGEITVPAGLSTEAKEAYIRSKGGDL